MDQTRFARTWDRIVSWYENGTLTDLTIICKDQQWNVRRTVFVFQSECLNSMVPSDSRFCRIELDEDPKVVDAMIRFFYYSRYSNQNTSMHPLRLEFLVFLAAEKYMLEALKDFAFRNFTKELPSSLATTAFAGILREIYRSDRATTVDMDRFKKVVVDAVVRNADDIPCDRTKYSHLHAVLDSNSEFAADVRKGRKEADVRNEQCDS